MIIMALKDQLKTVCDVLLILILIRLFQVEEYIWNNHFIFSKVCLFRLILDVFHDADFHTTILIF